MIHILDSIDKFVPPRDMHLCLLEHEIQYDLSKCDLSICEYSASLFIVNLFIRQQCEPEQFVELK